MRKHLLKKLIKITIMISLISCMLVSNILLQGTVLANGSDIYNESTSTETTSEATTASEPMESSVQTEESEEPSAQTEEPEESPAQVEESANTTYAANSINGMLWLDANNDGVRDAAEQPIVGYTVYLYAENDTDNAVQTAVTVADGTYSFSDVTAGSYVVGVISATVGGQEYLLPLVGITNDNAFAIASDWVNAYSEPISISDGGIVIGIDAGIRTPPGVQTMAGEPYMVVANSGTYNSPQWDLWGVAGGIQSGVAQGYGSSYTVIVQGNSTNAGSLNLNAVASGLDITVTSANTTPYIITAGSDFNYIFNMGNNNLTLENIILDGYSGTIRAGGVSMEGGTLKMKSGSTIRNFHGRDANFYGVYLLNGSTFNMTGGTISGNENYYYNGGGVYLQGSIFNMSGGTICNNMAGDNGGGVYLQDSTCDMSGGTISNNTASGDGGGVYLQNSTFTMDNASTTISTNTAQVDGGGVYVMGDCNFKMINGVIDQNEAITGSGGGVYVFYQGLSLPVTSQQSILFGGTISNNTATGTADSKGGGIAFFVNLGADFTIPASLKGNVIGNEATIGGGISVMNASGQYLVTLNCTDTIIKGNKATTNYSGGYGGGIATVNSKDNSDNDFGTIEIIINENTTIVENEAGTNANGGGVFCDKNTSFKMNGGLIDKNKTESGNGGGVFFTSGSLALFEMSNGTISNNTSIWEGGGLYMGAAASATISGPGIKITGNKAVNGGGGIFFQGGSGTLIIEGAEISGNEITASGWGDSGGGGVYCGADASLDIKNVKIANNNLEVGGMKKGGGVYFNSTGLFTMTGGEISNNTSSYDGGGIYIVDGGKAKITDSNISDNKVTGNGGGIYLENAPYSYSNLDINSTTTFGGNEARVCYEPPTNVYNIYGTIDNKKYSENTINPPLTTPSPLNNYDINLVAYRVILINSSASLADLGNIAATFTHSASKQTVILSDTIKEYSGYPALDTGSNTYEYGIEMLSTGTWDVNLNLPDGYSYTVSLNEENSGNNFTINDDIKVKYIKIEVKKTGSPWGKWIYKFK